MLLILLLAFASLAFGQPAVTGNQLDLGSNQFKGTLRACVGIRCVTTLPATCTLGELVFKTNVAPGLNWYGCTSTNTWTVMSGGGAGGGTVTVQGAGSLNSGGIMTGAGLQTSQTASPLATLISNNFSTPGTYTAGVGSSEAGGLDMVQGTALTPPANTITMHAPTSVPTAFTIVPPSASTTGCWKGTDSAGPGGTRIHTVSIVACGTASSIPYGGAMVNAPGTVLINGWSIAGTNQPTVNALAASPWNGGILGFSETATVVNTASNQYVMPPDVDCSGTFTLRIFWYPSAGALVGEVMKWFVLTSFIADGTDSSVSPTFNTADTATSTLGAAPAAKQVTTTVTLTNGATGCAANRVMRLQLKRDKNDVADTMAVAAQAYATQLLVPTL